MPCEQGQLYCGETDDSEAIYWYGRSYWIDDGLIWIFEGDVGMPCNYCFLAGKRCDEKQVFDHQHKCGENKYTIGIDFTPEAGANYTNATFQEPFLRNQQIKKSSFKSNICMFNGRMEQSTLFQANFTDRVGFYNTQLRGAQIRHSHFVNQVYFKHVDFSEAFMVYSLFEDQVSFYNANFTRA